MAKTKAQLIQVAKKEVADVLKQSEQPDTQDLKDILGGKTTLTGAVELTGLVGEKATLGAVRTEEGWVKVWFSNKLEVPDYLDGVTASKLPADKSGKCAYYVKEI
jgi:hypothetical protein